MAWTCGKPPAVWLFERCISILWSIQAYLIYTREFVIALAIALAIGSWLVQTYNIVVSLLVQCIIPNLQTNIIIMSVRGTNINTKQPARPADTHISSWCFGIVQISSGLGSQTPTPSPPWAPRGPRLYRTFRPFRTCLTGGMFTYPYRSKPKPATGWFLQCAHLQHWTNKSSLRLPNDLRIFSRQ